MEQYISSYTGEEIDDGIAKANTAASDIINIQNSVSNIADDVSDLQSSVSSNTNNITTIQNSVSNIADDVSDLQSSVSSNTNNITTIQNSGTPVAFTNRSLSNSDDGGVFICAAARIATVPAGLKSNFGCSFKGVISFTASGTTVNDIRQTGFTSPWCSLICIGANVFDVVGGKA